MPPEPSDPDPRTERSRRREGGKPNSDSSLMWIGVGFELAGAIGAVTALGWLVDYWLGTSPWGLIAGAMIGIVGGLYNLIKQVMKTNR